MWNSHLSPSWGNIPPFPPTTLPAFLKTFTHLVKSILVWYNPASLWAWAWALWSHSVWRLYFYIPSWQRSILGPGHRAEVESNSPYVDHVTYLGKRVQDLLTMNTPAEDKHAYITVLFFPFRHPSPAYIWIYNLV